MNLRSFYRHGGGGAGYAVHIAPIVGGGVGLLFVVLGSVMATVCRTAVP